MDLRFDRINLELDEGVVTKCSNNKKTNSN